MRAQRGFTLLEALVALALLALLALTSYRALDAVLTGERAALAEMAGWRELARAFARVEADLADATALATAPTRGFQLVRGEAIEFAFDRLLPEDRARAPQRVAYRYQAGVLSRRAWDADADDAVSGDAHTGDAVAWRPMLTALRAFELRLLDASGEWQAAWSDPAQMPRAVEFHLRTADDAALRRVFRLR